MLRNSTRFRRVVLIEYPRDGIYALGFVTGMLSAGMQAGFPQPMISVFIPTAPNPHHRLVQHPFQRRP